jgi:hypothetical protein
MHREDAGLSTGLTGLDRLLTGHGLPRGRITEITGGPSSGKTSLVLHIIATATRAGLPVAYIDLARSFYPPSAAAAGTHLDRLLLVRVSDVARAMKAADILLRGQAFPLVVFGWSNDPEPDASIQDLGSAIARLNGLCALSRTALLFITSPKTARDPLRYYATLRLETRRERGSHGVAAQEPASGLSIAPKSVAPTAAATATPPVPASGLSIAPKSAAPTAAAAATPPGPVSGLSIAPKSAAPTAAAAATPPGPASGLSIAPKSAALPESSGPTPWRPDTPLRLVGIPVTRPRDRIAIQIVKNKLGPPGGGLEVTLDGNPATRLPLHPGVPDPGPSAR